MKLKDIMKMSEYIPIMKIQKPKKVYKSIDK